MSYLRGLYGACDGTRTCDLLITKEKTKGVGTYFIGFKWSELCVIKCGYLQGYLQVILSGA